MNYYKKIKKICLVKGNDEVYEKVYPIDSIFKLAYDEKGGVNVSYAYLDTEPNEYLYRGSNGSKIINRLNKYYKKLIDDEYSSIDIEEIL